jgi:hypothetical protein
MSNLYQMFERTPMETEGIFIDYGPVGKFRIARAGGSNDRFVKAVERECRPYRKAIQLQAMDPKIADAIMYKVFAETVLLGWEGVKDKENKAIPFSVEAAIKLFTDLPDLFTDLNEQATTVSNFREGVREDDLKNSGTS